MALAVLVLSEGFGRALIREGAEGASLTTAKSNLVPPEFGRSESTFGIKILKRAQAVLSTIVPGFFFGPFAIPAKWHIAFAMYFNILYLYSVLLLMLNVSNLNN